MAKDNRLRYAITPENYENLKKIQAFAILDGKECPNLSSLVNQAIEVLVEKVLEDLHQDQSKYHLYMIEMLQSKR